MPIRKDIQIFEDLRINREKAMLEIAESSTNYLMQNVFELCQLDESSLFIDLGANTGQQVSLLCERNVETIAFEPHPVIYNELVSTYGKNENLTCYQMAAWIEDNVKDLYFKNHPQKINGGATLIREKTNAHGVGFRVQCIDFAKFLKTLNRKVDALKIDIEGSEYHVLKHLIENDCSKYLSNIFVEDHERKIRVGSSFYEEYMANRVFVHDYFSTSKVNYFWWK